MSTATLQAYVAAKIAADKAANPAAGHFRRMRGFDYSRGGSIFITIVLAVRQPLFGHVEHDQMILSAAGKLLAEQIARVQAENPLIRIRCEQIMPDHYHARLTWPAGLADATQQIGNFVGRIKQYSQYYLCAAGLSEKGLWEKGYHDHLCQNRFIIDQVDKYIRNNALKWHLMHQGGQLRVQEPLFAARLPGEEWWSGVGALGLIGDTQKLCAVQLSRRIREADYPAVLARLLSATDKGYVFAGTFISPLERQLYDELVRRGLPVIRAVPDPLAMVYCPHGDEPQLFDAGRLLLLSRQVATADRYSAWHGINAALGAMARENGDDLYVRPARDGHVRWLFNEAATAERVAVVGR